MKLTDIKDKIDTYFDNISPEEFYKILIKYHMRTSFKGTINGKEFTNIQDYNAEMQRLIAAGEHINAHADTQTIETPDDNSFLFPGFAQCTSISQLTDDFIDVALSFEPDEFTSEVNNLLHEKIIPAINKMTSDQITRYKNLVAGILGYLSGLAKDSDKKAEATITRLQAIEKELEELKQIADMESDRKAIIEFVTSLYESIDDTITARGNVAMIPQPCTCTGDPAGPQGLCETPGENYIEEIKAKARALFGL